MMSSLPRLALINDFTGLGHCSTAVSLPILSLLQIQTCPLPTAILSNHLDFPTHYFRDCTEDMPGYFRAWEELKIQFDGLYIGFLGNEHQIDLLCQKLDGPLFRDSLFLLDPVMGDHGRLYSSITQDHCRKMRTLASRAHILTPNITEACLLTGRPYKTEWTDEELREMCSRLSTSRQKIVITGIQMSDSISNYIWDGQLGSLYSRPIAGSPRPGTGDIFASVIAAHALRGTDFALSVRLAADFVALCIEDTQSAGIAIQEGVLFERSLASLL